MGKQGRGVRRLHSVFGVFTEEGCKITEHEHHVRTAEQLLARLCKSISENMESKDDYFSP